MGNLPKAGYRSLHCVFGDEDNEITQEYFVRDYVELENVLNVLLPSPLKPYVSFSGSGYMNLPSTAFTNPVFPSLPHPRFSSFICRRVEVENLDRKSVQGSFTDATFPGWTTFFDTDIPVVNGLLVRATFRPIAQEGQVTKITDEQWDFSSQTFSLIANAPAAAESTSVHWEWGQLVTNLKAIVRVLPKVELIQKRIICKTIPTTQQLALIGSVNTAPVNLGATASGQLMQFPAETLLLLGLPVIRRFRWDGLYMCEVGLKFAANLYQDSVAFVSGGGGGPTNGGTDYVTWNRLYFPNLGLWGRVQLGSNNAPLYQKQDLNILNTIGI